MSRKPVQAPEVPVVNQLDQQQTAVPLRATAINFVLDQTGSMQSVRQSTIDGFNTFLKEQQAAPEPASLSLMLFSSILSEQRLIGVALDKVEPLTLQSYVPNGNTPLYDAIGRSIGELERWLDAPGTPQKADPPAVLFVTMTDGEENCSREFTRDQIRMLIQQKEAAGWTFVYLGANQDAWLVAETLGYRVGNTATYLATAVGTITATATISGNTTMYRAVNAKRASMDDQVRASASFFAPDPFSPAPAPEPAPDEPLSGVGPLKPKRQRRRK